MKDKLLIKICGIRSPDEAFLSARYGADYIGMVFYNKSSRCIKSSSLAKEISLAATEGGAEPVAVFVDHELDEMNDICTQANINIVQLHGKIAKSFSRAIGMSKICLYSVSVNDQGQCDADDAAMGAFMTVDKDFVLYDHGQGGTGIAFHWDRFAPYKGFRWFLAGGLNAENVAEAIVKLRPNGVDVSSGVENTSKSGKDLSLVEKFIDQARMVFQTIRSNSIEQF